MKQYIKKEKESNKYEYGYEIQKLDIEFMLELGIILPEKLKQIHGKGFKEEELGESIYFNDPDIVEFISRQYYIRNIEEYANLNLFEIQMLIDKYKMKLSDLNKKKRQVNNKEKLNDIDIEIKVLTNELLSIVYLKDRLLNSKKNKIKVR